MQRDSRGKLWFRATSHTVLGPAASASLGTWQKCKVLCMFDIWLLFFNWSITYICCNVQTLMYSFMSYSKCITLDPHKFCNHLKYFQVYSYLVLTIFTLLIFKTFSSRNWMPTKTTSVSSPYPYKSCVLSSPPGDSHAQYICRAPSIMIRGHSGCKKQQRKPAGVWEARPPGKTSGKYARLSDSPNPVPSGQCRQDTALGRSKHGQMDNFSQKLV